MLVPKSLWTLPSASSLKPRKARHFPKAGAVPSVFFFFARLSPKWEYEARRRMERKRDVCPRRRLWEFGPNDDATHFLKLAESKGKRLQRRRSLWQEAFFSGCTWKSTGVVHTVGIPVDDWEILGVQEARLYWTAIDCVLFFFLKYSFRPVNSLLWVSLSVWLLAVVRLAIAFTDKTRLTGREMLLCLCWLLFQKRSSKTSEIWRRKEFSLLCIRKACMLSYCALSRNVTGGGGGGIEI